MFFHASSISTPLNFKSHVFFRLVFVGFWIWIFFLALLPVLFVLSDKRSEISDGSRDPVFDGAKLSTSKGSG